jgi:hypothetical protein
VANRLRLAEPGRAWLLLALLAAVGTLLAWWLPANSLDWQPAAAAAEPWRAVTGARVHWSPQHLVANLAGCAVVAALGWVARLPARAALAWAVAWPATQWGLLGWPALAHYGGLSGVLHAGVAVAGLWLVAAPPALPPEGPAGSAAGEAGARDTARGPDQRPAALRRIGAAILAGLAVKLVLEEPWGPLLRPLAGWDIAAAPIAHALGSLAGLAAAGLLLWWPRRG